ncbi:MAG: hypothetical protein GXP40_07565 [Chloroflexi bacterium]|nr:hypothetical protein [Chloroflexota bacterium]
MDVLTNRIRRVVESILENESLADGLDTSAAEALQAWGIASMSRIAEDTGGLDDEAAEQVMYPRLRAVRRLMRAVRNWIVHQQTLDPAARAALWGKIVKRARVVYGDHVMPPSPEQITSDDAAQFIVDLRAWFERGDDTSHTRRNDGC